MVLLEPQVLVVDDERFFRDAIRETLTAAEIPCLVAEGGDDALEAVAQPTIGAVILDIQLSGTSGIDVLRRLRAARPELRVIVVSSHTHQDDVLEALRVHGCDYLAKPLHDEELVLSVQRALASYEAERGLASLRRRVAALDARIESLAERVRGEALPERVSALAAEVAEAVGEVLGATKTSLMVLAPDAQELRVAGVSGRALKPEQLDSVPLGKGVAGFAAARGELLVVEDLAEDGRFADRPVADRYASRALVVAPLRRGGSVAGVLCATDRPGGEPFGEAEVSLLRVLALQVETLLFGGGSGTAADGGAAADPLTSLGMEPEPTLAERDAELARSVCEALTAEVEPERILTAALRAISRVLAAAPVSLYLLDEATGVLRLEAQWEGAGLSDRSRLERGRGLTGTVFQTGGLVATDRPRSDARFESEVDTPEGGFVQPLLCVPLVLRGVTLGVLRVFLGEGARASARTAEVLSASVSAAVRNVLLYRSLIEAVDDLARARREGGVRR